MNSREVQELIRREGEQGVRKALIALAENHSHMRQEFKELAALVVAMANTIETVTNLATGIGERFQQWEKRFNPDHEGGETPQ